MPWMDNLVAAWERAGIDGRFLTREDEPDRATIADAIAKLERRLERTKRLYLAGDMSDEEYDAERERLGRQRQAYELAAAEAAQTADPAELDSIASMWRSEDGATRAKVLWSLFDRLTVKDYAIVDYTPRSDRIRLTTALVEGARRPTSPAAVTLADHEYMSDEEIAEMDEAAEREGRTELVGECDRRNSDPATY